ncbi:hypothetical protein SSCG_04950 [Streptomyces clavuligerus]|nr:hypothetical protein SSCG_04950 [Streptomyces clavuligerus]
MCSAAHLGADGGGRVRYPLLLADGEEVSRVRSGGAGSAPQK